VEDNKQVNTMMIAVIGTGHIGKTLVRKLTKAGHFIQMANSRGPETLKELAEETVAKALTAEEAVRGVDAIILSIPLNKLHDIKRTTYRVAERGDCCRYLKLLSDS
jgi:8-hydroxy-5-deazaflavin:NADPH oxidoreductase